MAKYLIYDRITNGAAIKLNAIDSIRKNKWVDGITSSYCEIIHHPTLELDAIIVDETLTDCFTQIEIDNSVNLTDDWFPKIPEIKTKYSMTKATMYKDKLFIVNGSRTKAKDIADLTERQAEPIAYLYDLLGQFTQLDYDKATNTITIDGVSMKANELNVTELLDWVESILNEILNE